MVFTVATTLVKDLPHFLLAIVHVDLVEDNSMNDGPDRGPQEKQK